MIQLRTVLNVADNSGAKKILCVQVKGGSFRKVGTVGDVIVGAVREAAPNANIKKGDVVKAVIVRTKKEIRRKDGSYVRFDDNAAVVIDNNGDPKGTRIFGPVARELRKEIHAYSLSGARSSVGGNLPCLK